MWGRITCFPVGDIPPYIAYAVRCPVLRYAYGVRCPVLRYAYAILCPSGTGRVYGTTRRAVLSECMLLPDAETAGRQIYRAGTSLLVGPYAMFGTDL
eukprot:3503734-Rhodomonas_salina.4